MTSDTTNTHHTTTQGTTSALPTAGTTASDDSSPRDGLAGLAGLADLFGFPAPMHWPRPRGCQWCEPQEAQVSTLREENPIKWVLHVLAEHVPQDILHRVSVDLRHELGKVEVHAHGHTFDQVDRIAEALDLFAQDVRTLSTGTAVAVFGSDHDAVTLHWYTALENVNPALTPEPTSYNAGTHNTHQNPHDG